MRILLDADALLDVALARDPFAVDSADVLRWAETGGAAAVAWHSLTNCAYLLKGGGRPFLERLLRLVEVAPVATADARHALDLPLSDLQDAFQAAAALAWQADVIVTRNVSDYRRSPVRAISLRLFSSAQQPDSYEPLPDRQIGPSVLRVLQANRMLRMLRSLTNQYRFQINFSSIQLLNLNVTSNFTSELLRYWL